jgi:hypothetical protein
MDETKKVQRARARGYTPGARVGIFTVVEAPDLTSIRVRCDCGRESIRRACEMDVSSCFSGCPLRKNKKAWRRQRAYKNGFTPGARIGIFTVIEASNLMSIEVRCDCGLTQVRSAQKLRKLPPGCSRQCGLRKEQRAQERGFTPGTRFGSLVVVKASNLDAITVRCGCGQESVRTARSLRRIRGSFCSFKCGLRGWEGRKFGLLTVTGKVGPRRWACQCECGGATEADASNLRSGRTKSCGCLKKSSHRGLRKDPGE